MKKNFILLFAIGCLLTEYSQGQTRFFTGLNFNYTGGTEERFLFFNPHFGYNLNEHMAVVAGVTLSQTEDKYKEETTKAYGFAAEFRYGWSIGDHAGFFVAPGGRYESSTDDYDLKTEFYRIEIAPAVSFQFANRWTITAKFASLGYQSETTGELEPIEKYGLDLSMNSLSFGLDLHF